MNPYENLPDSAFWKPAVASRSPFDIEGLWTPKSALGRKAPVVTYGSCFAQHIGRALRANGFDWLDMEPAPSGLLDADRERYNYGVFSARTGNIYTTSLLGQWVRWALDDGRVPAETWERGGRFFDPFRPNVEPDGFRSPEEMRDSRRQAIGAFRESIRRASLFVFTLGLTESWRNRSGGYEYPMCPGTVAGTFDDSEHVFENQYFDQILQNLSDAMALMRGLNPTLRFLLTVSPVPLTATRSNEHVLVATMASKSTLRAVSAQLARNRDYVDYFPSYEIINSPAMKGMFFEPNQRSVNPRGVSFVMESFFNCLKARFGDDEGAPSSPSEPDEAFAPVCEEELLAAFAR